MTKDQMARTMLLARLGERRRALVDSYAVGLIDADLDTGGLAPTSPLAPSTFAPLAQVQAAIAAVEAELAEGES